VEEEYWKLIKLRFRKIKGKLIKLKFRKINTWKNKGKKKPKGRTLSIHILSCQSQKFNMIRM